MESFSAFWLWEVSRLHVLRWHGAEPVAAKANGYITAGNIRLVKSNFGVFSQLPAAFKLANPETSTSIERF